MTAIVRMTTITATITTERTTTNRGIHGTTDGLPIIIMVPDPQAVIDDPATTVVETLRPPIINDTPCLSLGKTLPMPRPIPHGPEKIIPHKIKYPNSSKGNLVARP